MKQKMMYECEICGALSEEPGTISCCEAQGSPCKYPNDTAVEFISRNLGRGRWFPGIIEVVTFHLWTHKPEYKIRITPAVSKQLGLGVDCEYYETSDEQAIRPPQPEPQAAAV